MQVLWLQTRSCKKNRVSCVQTNVQQALAKGPFCVRVPLIKKVQQFEEKESSHESCLKVETVSLVLTRAKQWFADVSFFKSAEEDFTTILAYQPDTGASCTLLCLDELSIIIQLGDPPMDNLSVKLKLFCSSPLKPVSECKLHVQHKRKRKTLMIQFIENKCKPLLWAETCEMFQLIRLIPEIIHQISNSPMQNPLSREVLGKYYEVFSSLGHIGYA